MPLSADPHNAFMVVRCLALFKVRHLCSGIQLETDLVNWKQVEVKEEPVPLIFPAVTRGRKGEKKQGTV